MAGNGTNCEVESAHACKTAGFQKVDIVTVWELLDGEYSLDNYDFLVLPGGFLDGDDLGSAKAQANRLLHTSVKKTGQPVLDQFKHFISEHKLVLGICNGFQLLVKLGLVPALEGKYMEQQATLTFNDSGRFEDRWVDLQVNRQSNCVFTKDVESLYLPVRHGEGKFVASDKSVIDTLKAGNQIVLNYVDPDTNEPTQKYPYNPNGSQSAIAGVCDPTGRIFGLMPHPEAYLHRTNHPRWTREKLPEEGAGVILFRNALEYLTSR